MLHPKLLVALGVGGNGILPHGPIMPRSIVSPTALVGWLLTGICPGHRLNKVVALLDDNGHEAHCQHAVGTGGGGIPGWPTLFSSREWGPKIGVAAVPASRNGRPTVARHRVST